MAHLFVAVTAHGFGHLAQIAPVLHALRRRRPDLRVTVQGDLPLDFVRYRLPAGVDLIAHAADVALPMDSPLKVRWDEGLALYEAFEANYASHLSAQLRLLDATRPDLVLADIPWLTLDAARQLGIPAVGFCSLNWLDILLESPIGNRVSAGLEDRLRGAYAQAERFIQPTPSMPMRWLSNIERVGPVADVRERNPDELRERLGIKDDRRLVLMQFGGTGWLDLDPGALQEAAIQILTADPAIVDNPAISRIGGPGLGMLEVLASCDAMITKPGYGSFTEAACHGIPVLYVPRDDWPESRALVDWLRLQIPTATITPEQLAAGEMIAPIENLLDQTKGSDHTAVTRPTGIGETVDILLRWLR